MTPDGSRTAAFAVLADKFGTPVAAMVAAVTNPEHEPGRDKYRQYREHVTASLQASPWARVIKVSDFTDNAIGLIHTTGPKVTKLAMKYRPLIPVLRDFILSPDTPSSATSRTWSAASSTPRRNGSPQSWTSDPACRRCLPRCFARNTGP